MRRRAGDACGASCWPNLLFYHVFRSNDSSFFFPVRRIMVYDKSFVVDDRFFFFFFLPS
jgi:hypothetical protein